MKVIKVQFKGSREVYYFSSVAAIYDRFNKETIGVVIGSIWNQFHKRGFYEGAKVSIHAFPVQSKKRLRSKKKDAH